VPDVIKPPVRRFVKKKRDRKPSTASTATAQNKVFTSLSVPGYQGVKVKGKVDHAPVWSIGGSSPFPWPLSLYVDKPLKSVMYSQSEARRMVTFPVAEHHCPLAGNRHMGVGNLPRVVV